MTESDCTTEVDRGSYKEEKTIPQVLYELGHDLHLTDQDSWLDSERYNLPPLEK